jgi:hypothetical protein
MHKAVLVFPQSHRVTLTVIGCLILLGSSHFGLEFLDLLFDGGGIGHFGK